MFLWLQIRFVPMLNYVFNNFENMSNNFRNDHSTLWSCSFRSEKVYFWTVKWDVVIGRLHRFWQNAYFRFVNYEWTACLVHSILFALKLNVSIFLFSSENDELFHFELWVLTIIQMMQMILFAGVPAKHHYQFEIVALQIE